MAETPIVVFADGAAKGNPGPGGWGAIVVTPEGRVTELGGGAGHTTNNRMELTATIEALLDIPDDTGLPARSPGTSAAGRRSAAHSYLSVVDGQLGRHATWAECERRVKGRSGARFKKAMSPADEEAILRSWGFSANDP